MPTILTPEQLRDYFDGNSKYLFYEEATEEAESLNVHASMDYPEEAIEGRRPNEDEAVKTYRKQIYRSQTKGPLQKVMNEMQKIRKADDWSVRYPAKMPAAVDMKAKNPKTYFEEEFPKFTSLTNWGFSVLLNGMLLEANSVVMVLPLNRKEQEADGSVLLKPFPLWFPAASVIEFVEEDFCILQSVDKVKYKDGDAEYDDGDVFYLADTVAVTRYIQTDTKRNFVKDWTWTHNRGYLPAFKVKGQFKKSREGQYLYESRLAAMIPHLDECAREYSDLQAEVVQHVHSEKWVFDPQQCPTCKGAKKVRKGEKGALVVCDDCKGQGVRFNTPYGVIVIKPAKPGQEQWRGDPAGYIKRDVEIIKVQDARIDKHIWKALSTVGMEHLAEVPLAESGLAKAMDQDSANTFVNAVAEDLVWCLDMVYAMGIDIRYAGLIPSEDQRKSMRPSVAVPTKLHILSANYLVNEVKAMRDAKVSPVIIIATEIELAEKKFINNPTLRDILVTAFKLDPLAGLSIDEKNAMLQNKGVKYDDYVLSCNINALVNYAFQENPEFASLKLPDQKVKVLELAKPIIEAGQKSLKVVIGQEPPVQK